MIQPIQAVGLTAPGFIPELCCRFRLSLACVLQFRNLNAVWAEHRARMDVPNRLAAPLADVLAARLRCSQLALPYLPSTPVETAQPWQPWPAHGPFATEVRRWWPSDEFPPPEAVVIVEQQPAALQPAALNRGNFIDLWG